VETRELLGDLSTWATFVAPSHAEAVAAFVGGIENGRLEVSVVREMRRISAGIHRIHLVANPDKQTSFRRSHLYVTPIHRLLDHIEHLSRTDADLLL
jgi:hypothetical protein